jgi:hypothetical protein
VLRLYIRKRYKEEIGERQKKFEVDERAHVVKGG